MTPPDSPDNAPPAPATRERRFLETESVRWKNLGLIDAGTRSALLALYPESPAPASRLEGVAKAVGASLLGMALLLFNAHNWDRFSPWTRFGVLTLALVACHVATLLCLRAGKTTLGKALAILASAAFGGGIMLVGQAFNLESGTAAPFAVWTLGVLPFAVMLASFPLYLFAGALSLVVLFWNSGYGFRHGTVFDPAKCLPLLVAAFAMTAGYLRGRRALVALAIPLVGAVLIESPGLFDGDCRAIGAGAVAAGFCLLIASLHREDDPLRLPWRNWAGWTAMIFLTFMASPKSLREWRDSATLFAPGSGLALASFVVIAGLLFRKRLAEGNPFTPGTIIGAATVAAAIATPPTSGLALILFNLAHLAFGVLLLRDGAKIGRAGGYTLGVLVLGVWAVARYVDFGDDFGMVGAAAMLAVAGIGLFVAARVWKNVREERIGLDAVPVPAPAFLKKIVAGAEIRRLRLLTVAGAATVGVLAFMACDASRPLWTGKEIRMEVVPVDPRDLLRGDYVTLDFKACHPDKIDRPALGPGYYRERSGMPDDDVPVGSAVYVTLADDGSGVLKPVRWTLEKPPNGLFIKGVKTNRWNGAIRLGIEQFYVREGTGRTWENARNNRRLVATLRVTTDGEARVTGLSEADAPRRQAPVATRTAMASPPIPAPRSPLRSGA